MMIFLVIASILKPRFSISTPSMALTPEQAAFDYPAKIRELADLMEDDGKRILESATVSAKAKELIFRSRLKSRSEASATISKNNNELLISCAGGFASLANIGDCQRLFDAIPPPPPQWEKPYRSLQFMQEALQEILRSCDHSQHANKQRHFKGVPNDSLLDDPEFFEADLDFLENKVSGIRLDRKLIEDALPK